jgi:hypothetical protein
MYRMLCMGVVFAPSTDALQAAVAEYQAEFDASENEGELLSNFSCQSRILMSLWISVFFQ